MSFLKRSSQLEWIDQGSAFYTLEEYEDCLTKLGIIGKCLGGDSASMRAFKKIQPLSILDVGCGGGHFSGLLARYFSHASVLGIDISRPAIDYAKKKYLHPNLSFECPASVELNYLPNSFDVVTATLVCHHMKDLEIIKFLKDAYIIANKKVIINDLHRSRLAYSGFWITTPFFNNRLITHDGLLSIKRSFKRGEWIKYLEAAEIPLKNCLITWNWAFRWVIEIDATKKLKL